MLKMLAAACRLLDQGQALVIAKITSQRGSTPRTAGTQMLITADGGIVGTIGGGLLEGQAIAEGRRLLAAGAGRWLTFDLTHDDVAAMDMICGGTLEVLLDYLPADDQTRLLLHRWRTLLERGEQGWLLTLYRATAAGVGATAHCLVLADGSRMGHIDLPAERLTALIAAQRQTTCLQVHEQNGQRLVIEPAQRPDTLYLFGAGHVAVPTAALAAQVGFRVEVFDDRAAFANRQRFPTAAAVHVLADFNQALQGLHIDALADIAILTRGHLHDRTVLAQALRTPAGYIGMIGSRRKRDALYDSLRAEGFSDTDLARVHSPIGLAIAAESPAEIAVSIVAELIQERARRRV